MPTSVLGSLGGPDRFCRLLPAPIADAQMKQSPLCKRLYKEVIGRRWFEVAPANLYTTYSHGRNGTIHAARASIKDKDDKIKSNKVCQILVLEC